MTGLHSQEKLMNDAFEINCDQCGKEFQSDVALWERFDELYGIYEKLMLIMNPCGFHDPWFCSEKCQKEAIKDAAKDVLSRVG